MNGPTDPGYAEALRLTRDLDPSASNLSRIGKLTSPDLARAAFSQWKLRTRARQKFPESSEMFFLAEALEQATSRPVARYHASLFAPGILVADLTAGIGGDTIELARRGPVIAFELDAERCAVANANLDALGLEPVVRNEDGLEWLKSHAGVSIFVDPARRVHGKRVLDPDQFTPNPRTIAEHSLRQCLTVMKLSPLVPDELLLSLATRLEFVSHRGECCEVLCIQGGFAARGRYAVQAESGEVLMASPGPEPVTEPLEFVFDCDPAAVRAHAIGTLCEQVGAVPLGESHGYLTGSRPVKTPWTQGFRVLSEGSGDLKSTRRQLMSRDSATPVLKQRLTGFDLIDLRKRLKLTGQVEHTVLIFRSGGRVRHLIAQKF